MTESTSAEIGLTSGSNGAPLISTTHPWHMRKSTSRTKASHRLIWVICLTSLASGTDTVRAAQDLRCSGWRSSDVALESLGDKGCQALRGRGETVTSSVLAAATMLLRLRTSIHLRLRGGSFADLASEGTANASTSLSHPRRGLLSLLCCCLPIDCTPKESKDVEKELNHVLEALLASSDERCMRRLSLLSPAAMQAMNSLPTFNKTAWVHACARRGLDGALQKLHNLGVSFNLSGPLGQTPLHVAAGSDSAKESTVDVLCEIGAYVDTKDMLGWTALHHAVFVGNLDSARRLVSFLF